MAFQSLKVGNSTKGAKFFLAFALLRMTVDLLSFLNKLGILLNNIRSHSSRKHKAIRTRIENLVVVVLALSEASNSIPSHSVHTPQFSKLLENVLDALPEVIKTRNGKLCEGALGV